MVAQQKGQAAILVTGACGYIGSHVCYLLSELGHKVIALDSLVTGKREALLHGETFYEGDVGDRALVAEILARHRCESVLHFAASILVEESMREPLAYYDNNVASFIGFLTSLQASSVRRFVLSSSAAVYGQGSSAKLCEDDPLAPINPYGRSKLMDEWLLQDTAGLLKLNYVILRYFNVAGAHRTRRIGQQGSNATHLVKMVSEVATGRRERLRIFGHDYPTPDGTCLRDYIHIEDLAEAHVAALDYLVAGGASTTLNCGYGHGFSVADVIRTAEAVTGQTLAKDWTARRPGDPPVLVADNRKILATLGWQAKRADLAQIIASAVDWEKCLAAKDPG